MRRPLLIAVLGLALFSAPAAVVAPAAAGADRSVPRGFFGVMGDGPLLAPATDLEHELGVMTANGVESLRVAFYWSDAQPSAGAPPSFAETDRIVAGAAQRGISVLPVVIRAPAWAAAVPGDSASPPKETRPYAAYLSALVGRYGPKGTLWTERPGLPRRPVRDWQVWNEPNITRYWSRQPFAGGYVRLLVAAQAAIRRADPRARVVLCGLANFSWRALREIYRAGAGGHFDVAAVHPFTGKVADALRIVELNRAVLRAHGDGAMPMMLTEVTWSSAKGRKLAITYGWETTEAGQARRLTAALRLFARERRRLRIERVYWYTWLTPDAASPSSFDWSGLRKLVGGAPVDKPALGAYRRLALALEGRRAAGKAG